LKGEPPPEFTIETDPQTAKLRRDPLKTRFYVLGPKHGLADVFVYLRDPIPGPFRDPKGPVILRIKGSQYEPLVVGIRTGQTLQIFNDDPFMHNVMSHLANGHDWNKAISSHTEPIEAQFKERELFAKLECDVHPWEIGYVCVMEHPFFAVTGPDGKFAFPPGMPDGMFTVVAVHRKLGTLEHEVTFENDSAAPVQFVFDVKTAVPKDTSAPPPVGRDTSIAIPAPAPVSVPEPASDATSVKPLNAGSTSPAAAPVVPAPSATIDSGVAVPSAPVAAPGETVLAPPVEPDDSKSRWLIAAILFALAIVCYRASKD
jgi:hypothetical protein